MGEFTIQGRNPIEYKGAHPGSGAGNVARRPEFGVVPGRQKREPIRRSQPRAQSPTQTSSKNPPVFGEPPARRPGYSSLREEIKTTVQPAGLVPPAERPTRRPALKPGDPFKVGPHLLRFNGVLGDKDTQVLGSFDTTEYMTITAIHRNPRGMTLELEHSGPEASPSHEFVGRIGPNWQLVTPDRVDPGTD